MIGYYVHHQGHGHLHRAGAIARELSGAYGIAVAGLSTRPRPDSWTGPWVELHDDADPIAIGDVTARGRLHYAPVGHTGHTQRMSAVSAWLGRARPQVVVADVSVEIALLARLHGVPVATVAMPGRRVDPAHDLGFAVSDLVLAPWPVAARRMMAAPPDVTGRMVPVGAISRYAPAADLVEPDRGTVLVLNGTGGGSVESPGDTDGWTWRRLGGSEPGSWAVDPWPALRTAEVIVAHCGQNAVAEIAAARRPAILLPQARPFDEQHHTARQLVDLDLPAVVCDAPPGPEEWAPLLDKAAALDGTDWVRWNDGGGPRRAAALLAERVARGAP